MLPPTTPPSSAIKPDHNEMHPSKAHHSTAEPSSAARLGFTDIPSASKRGSLGPVGQGTPSKINVMPSSNFSFAVPNPVASMQLSSEAQKIMAELQGEAAKIKANIVAEREAKAASMEASGRRIAKPKGRFSAAHTAEFDKMDSIENHASAWRASRFTPTVIGVKRSPSKSSLLEGTPTKSLVRSPSKTKLNEPAEQPRRNLKRKSSAANLDRAASVSPRKATAQPTSATRSRAQPTPEVTSAKRVKKEKSDDASSSRPGRLNTATPRSINKPLPKAPSVISRLMSPTKSSRAHTATTSKIAAPIVSTPSKAVHGSLSKPTAAAASSVVADNKRRILTPSRFSKVKSILRAQSSTKSSSRSAIPRPLPSSLTPAPPRTVKELPPVPQTTPRRKLAKRVTFTPDTKRAALSQLSPSPLRAGILKFGSTLRGHKQEEQLCGPTVAYPDLSAFSGLLSADKESQSPGPGTFSFRSDHTIEFKDISQKGFGSSRGQSSVRQVRDSMPGMPGSFPTGPPPPPSTHEDKENTAPVQSPNKLSGVSHGLTNKKRNRPSSDEEDAEKEAAERASKKQKSAHTPLTSARSVSATPASNKRARTVGGTYTPSRVIASQTPSSQTPASASPAKKRIGMSLSRLNMLARPKNRA